MAASGHHARVPAAALLRCKLPASRICLPDSSIYLGAHRHRGTDFLCKPVCTGPRVVTELMRRGCDAALRWTAYTTYRWRESGSSDGSCGDAASRENQADPFLPAVA